MTQRRSRRSTSSRTSSSAIGRRSTSARRRQVVPVHRGHGRGRVPAGGVHARAAPPRGFHGRPVCERAGVGDLDVLNGSLSSAPRGAQPGRHPGSRASTSTSSGAMRPASYLSKEGYREIVEGVINFSGDTQTIVRELEEQMREAGGGALRGRGALPEPPLRDREPCGAAGADRRETGSMDVLGTAAGDRRRSRPSHSAAAR